MDLDKPSDLHGCAFCDIVAGRAFAKRVADTRYSVAIHPLNPFVPGHLLFIPRVHVESAAESPALNGRVMEDAGTFANKHGVKAFNLITSAGEEASQTIFHLHVHLLPREDMSLPVKWPWLSPEVMMSTLPDRPYFLDLP